MAGADENRQRSFWYLSFQRIDVLSLLRCQRALLKLAQGLSGVGPVFAGDKAPESVNGARRHCGIVGFGARGVGWRGCRRGWLLGSSGWLLRWL